MHFILFYLIIYEYIQNIASFFMNNRRGMNQFMKSYAIEILIRLKIKKKKKKYTDNLLHLAPMKYCILHFE